MARGILSEEVRSRIWGPLPEGYTEEEYRSLSGTMKWKVRNPQKYAEYREYRQEQDLKRRRGISKKRYQELFDAQNGLCGICGKPESIVYNKYVDGVFTIIPKKLCVDHDHSCCSGNISCGKCIRGLLCWDCNKRVGSFNKEGIQWATSVIKYLTSAETKARRL